MRSAAAAGASCEVAVLTAGRVAVLGALWALARAGNLRVAH